MLEFRDDNPLGGVGGMGGEISVDGVGGTEFPFRLEGPVEETAMRSSGT